MSAEQTKKHEQPVWLHKAISWGASVVIMGALFKILHLGGAWADLIIGIGLTVEALLFFMSGFFPPEPEPEWERVYPELNKNFNGELPKSSSRLSGNGGGSSTAALDNMLAEAKIGPELIESLGAGLRNFGEKVSAISNVADASLAADEFTTKLKSTTASFDGLSAAFEGATKNLQEMGESKGDSHAYHEQVTNLAKNLSALNAVYELELQESSSHLKSMNKFYQNLASTMDNFNDSMEDSKAVKEQVGKLADNLSALNSVYGNMLTAMNPARV
ncbi:MAG: gliding motility protein GldL [Sphingobacteriaceae bacterium]|nr:gliding motility protein GldL [Sphingobacteriaceae bacterium]